MTTGILHTYTTKSKIYSVDLMIAYIRIAKPKPKKVLVSSLDHCLTYESWATEDGKMKYSANDVIDDKKNPIYTKEIEKIKKADMSYPIIIHSGYVVDGLHRLVKAKMNKDEKISAYIFDTDLMKKFAIKQREMSVWEVIELYEKRFK
jgi:hypothetical protein